jgi:hypothetical protein
LGQKNSKLSHACVPLRVKEPKLKTLGVKYEGIGAIHIVKIRKIPHLLCPERHQAFRNSGIDMPV